MTRCLETPSRSAPGQVALTGSARREKDLVGQLEAATAANTALKSRKQLLETFLGLQEPMSDAEQTGDCQWPCDVSDS